MRYRTRKTAQTRKLDREARTRSREEKKQDDEDEEEKKQIKGRERIKTRDVRGRGREKLGVMLGLGVAENWALESGEIGCKEGFRHEGG